MDDGNGMCDLRSGKREVHLKRRVVVEMQKGAQESRTRKKMGWALFRLKSREKGAQGTGRRTLRIWGETTRSPTVDLHIEWRTSKFSPFRSSVWGAKRARTASKKDIFAKKKKAKILHLALLTRLRGGGSGGLLEMVGGGCLKRKRGEVRKENLGLRLV